tara:strand:+ start:14251 stop:14634 length:384 start_codon:yes stop_codon:yes gene_type:complete
MALKAEEVDHINLVNWFHHNYPELADDLHHIANERKCSEQEGRKLKKMGVKRGVSDFFLAVPSNGKHGLWLELKVGKNKPSPEQIAFLERKSNNNYMAVCMWGFEACKEVIREYLRTENYTHGRPIC